VVIGKFKYGEFHRFAKLKSHQTFIVYDTSLLIIHHKCNSTSSQGHGISSLTLSVLLHRMEACKVPQWSRLGRLRRTKVPNSQAGAHVMCCGRLVCDIRLSCQELVRMRSYDLTGGWGCAACISLVACRTDPTTAEEEASHPIG